MVTATANTLDTRKYEATRILSSHVSPKMTAVSIGLLESPLTPSPSIQKLLDVTRFVFSECQGPATVLAIHYHNLMVEDFALDFSRSPSGR